MKDTKADEKSPHKDRIAWQHRHQRCCEKTIGQGRSTEAKIFNEQLYHNICSDWEAKNPDKAEHYKHFLLKYKY